MKFRHSKRAIFGSGGMGGVIGENFLLTFLILLTKYRDLKSKYTSH